MTSVHKNFQPAQNLQNSVLSSPWHMFLKRELPPHILQLILEVLNTKLVHTVQTHLHRRLKTRGWQVGAAVAVKDQNKAIITRLPSTYSIFAAEATALMRALKYIKTQSDC